MRQAIGLFVAAAALSACKRTPPPPSPDMPAPPAPETNIAAPSRCSPVSPEPPFVLGPADTGRPTAGDAGASDEDSLPFAALVGEGVAWQGGFAVGAIHESNATHSMSVVTLDANGKNAKIVSLGAARGDVEPPRLAARDGVLAAGVLEPSANGRVLRLAKIENGAATWGASVPEKADESQAFDFALGETKGIVVWDEEGATAGTIQVSTFDAATLANATPPRGISRMTADAESPRLVARPGGYWLAYIARSKGNAEPEPENEDVGFRWIEVVPLDANGSPTSGARVATPKDGHVLLFDIAPAPDGGALLVYRYDDTPIGAPGGEVLRVLVHPTGMDAPAVVAKEDVGAGVPNVLPGWIAVLDAADVTRIAPLGPLGDITGPLQPESSVGSGEPIAGAANRLLVARPSGRSVKLLVVECRPDVAPADP